MLLQTIQQYDSSKKLLKLVCIENIRTSNPMVLQRITAVPALMLLPSKDILFGKKVFDHLILPNHGVLVTNQPQSSSISPPSTGTSINNPTTEPIATTLETDPYAFIDENEDNNVLQDKKSAWEVINDSTLTQPTPTGPTRSTGPTGPTGPSALPNMNVETRSCKEIPDYDRIRMERDADLRSLQ